MVSPCITSINSINRAFQLIFRLFFYIWLTPSSSSSLLDLDVQGALCRTGVCTFSDMLHVFDGSAVHELRLVFRNLLEAA